MLAFGFHIETGAIRYTYESSSLEVLLAQQLPEGYTLFVAEDGHPARLTPGAWRVVSHDGLFTLEEQ